MSHRKAVIVFCLKTIIPASSGNWRKGSIGEGQEAGTGQADDGGLDQGAAWAEKWSLFVYILKALVDGSNRESRARVMRCSVLSWGHCR